MGALAGIISILGIGKELFGVVETAITKWKEKNPGTEGSTPQLLENLAMASQLSGLFEAVAKKWQEVNQPGFDTTNCDPRKMRDELLALADLQPIP